MLKVMVTGFLLKLTALAGGMLALQYSGQELIHPGAYGTACAAACLVFALPATWRVVSGGTR
jgi:hypothetical protein